MKLADKPYGFFTAKEIEPEGWLKQQLEIQAKGLSGNLDKVWPDVRDSKWFGGECEGWERAPYWLDGFVPMAYLLGDEELIGRAKKYINYIIEAQQEDGWLCPGDGDEEKAEFDEWGFFLICKALVVYYDCSGDERVEEVVYRAFSNLRLRIERVNMKSWAAYRWFEGLIPLYWLYERRPEGWMEELMHLLWEQGFSYDKMFKNWHGQKPVKEWRLRTHVVNIAMAFKSEAMISRILNAEGDGIDPDEFAESMYRQVYESHGSGVGHFNGDECISGTSPIRGAELCAVVELLYSFEWLFALTGKTKWLDRLEELAYNSNPAGTSPDMWVRQYDQMVNQIECSRFEEGKQPFLTNGYDGNLFGLEPNYGCCTANYHQGWPKFALSSFFRSGKGIMSAAICPTSVKTEIAGSSVSVRTDTLYPFRGSVRYVIETSRPTEFEFSVRIPAFCDAAKVDGKDAKPGEIYKINRVWSEKAEVMLELTLSPRLTDRPGGLHILKYGALAFSVPIESRWERYEYTDQGIERKFPYCDYFVYPESKWNYAFASDNFEVGFDDNYDIPFSQKKPPVYIDAEMTEINWGCYDGVASVARETPLEVKPLCEKKKIRLVPYGGAKLRMTEMPLIKD